MRPAPRVSIAVTSVSQLMADPAIAACDDWLSGTERERLARISAPNRRRQFVAGRWWARRLLAACFDGQLDDWSVSGAEDGPPQVTNGPVDPLPVVALSHSGDRVACAVAANPPLGLDIELPRQRERLEELAEFALHPSELLAWQSTDSLRQATEFHALWTVKEAWIKSQGRSLAPARLARMRSHFASVGDDVVARTFEVGDALVTVVCPAGYHIDWPHLPQSSHPDPRHPPRAPLVVDE